MAKIVKEPGTFLYPVPVVLLSARNNQDKINIITLAWVGTVNSLPPMLSVSIRKNRHTYPMVMQTEEFVVNIPTEDQLAVTDEIGVISGEKVDKFTHFKLTPEKAQKVQAPLIKECPVNIECVNKHTLNLGSHTCFLAEVVAVHFDDSIVDENENIDFTKAKPFAFCNGQYWNLKEQIGFYGFTRK